MSLFSRKKSKKPSASDTSGLAELALKTIHDGVLITDHNVRETLPLTERAYLIYDGKILVEGDQNTLLNDTNARRLYLGQDFKM